MSQPLTVECPIYGAPVEWESDSKYRSFCPDRCRLIDLGTWVAKGHATPGDILGDDIFSTDLPPREH